eukprot:CAMPEP_0185730448 /NCGR_PEP_ID=MMETSP1171-20130828/9871_1 /TAXON_ID=374046 /ORGANISM="Helicotheca tamensis, Strain CCMP826" /LENGTH=292 /DNA_ID=CAMNT_0028399489 /DNA_START=72 /DNA_END=950 /DNA_ORIENTATION=-
MKASTVALATILQLLSSPLCAAEDPGYRIPRSSLIALVEPFGDASEALGTATVSFNSDGSFLFALDMGGLKTDGTAIIAEGITCDSSGDGFSTTPYFLGSGYEWDGTTNFYNALSEGISKSAFRFNNGYGEEENDGHAVLIYNDSDDIVGCGTLGKEVNRKVLMAEMGKYPNYTGDLRAVGKVVVSFATGSDNFLFRYRIGGLEADCTDCGIHIHAGTSCETHELVKGHGWNSVVVQDLWTAAGGATYNTNAKGRAKGYFHMFNGYGYEENKNHAVVIHGQDGTRIACGLLM